MAVVIKLGGDVIDNVAGFLQGLTGKIAIVHGGGAQVTELSRKLGVEAKIVGGRRITDAATIQALEMTIAGQLNIELCAALQARGVAAVGLHAGSGVVRARRRPPRPITGNGPEPVDLGLVGDVTSFDLPLLEALWAAGRVPVLSCLGLGEQHEVLNLNADLVASQLAAALKAESLLAVTAVGGVRRDRNDPSSRIGRLTVEEARAAIASGQVQGGMIPKLEEAFAPLAAGVGSVQIIAPHEIAAALMTPGSVGTLLLAGDRA